MYKEMYYTYIVVIETLIHGIFSTTLKLNLEKIHLSILDSIIRKHNNMTTTYNYIMISIFDINLIKLFLKLIEPMYRKN